jgi:hypothetical protein
MREDVTANVSLTSLNELDVGLHTLLGESRGEQVAYVGVGVETTQLWRGSQRRSAER